MSVSKGPFGLEAGDHLCPMVEGESEQFRLLAEVVAAALPEGGRLMIAAKPDDFSAFVPVLENEGVDVEGQERRGKLSFLTDYSLLFRAGVYSPSAYLEFLDRAATRALEDGCTGLGFVGVNPFEGMDVELMIESEARMYDVLERLRLSVVCLYDRAKFEPEFLHDVVRVHPTLVMGDRRLSNPYFEPPATLLAPEPESESERKRKRLAWWMERLEAVRADEENRERVESRLRQAQRMDALGRLAGGVSHDFNNLLTSISGFTDLLASELEAGTTARAYAEEVRRAAERSAQLTEQLLTFSRKQVVRPAPVDVGPIVQQVAARVAPLYEEGIEVVATTGDTPATVFSEPGQLDLIITNLVRNASDAMPEGGTLTLEVDVRSLDEPRQIESTELPPGRYVVVRVADTGTGIPPEVRPYIFDPFFTTRPKGKGTGLGLAVVYGIVLQAGGEIEVESTVGEGTSVRVYLPAFEPEREVQVLDAEVELPPRMHQAERHLTSEAPLAARADQADQGVEGGKTVLVVEQEVAMQTLLAKVLRRLGCRVKVAPDGEAALGLLGQGGNKIDLLLVEAVTPGLDSETFRARLQSRELQLPVVFMIGLASELPPGFDDFDGRMHLLKKPFRLEALQRVLRKALTQTS